LALPSKKDILMFCSRGVKIYGTVFQLTFTRIMLSQTIFYRKNILGIVRHLGVLNSSCIYLTFYLVQFVFWYIFKELLIILKVLLIYHMNYPLCLQHKKSVESFHRFYYLRHRSDINILNDYYDKQFMNNLLILICLMILTW